MYQVLTLEEVEENVKNSVPMFWHMEEYNKPKYKVIFFNDSVQAINLKTDKILTECSAFRNFKNLIFYKECEEGTIASDDISPFHDVMNNDEMKKVINDLQIQLENLKIKYSQKCFECANLEDKCETQQKYIESVEFQTLQMIEYDCSMEFMMNLKQLITSAKEQRVKEN